MKTRAVAWSKDDPLGAEQAEIAIGADRLEASGVAIGSEPDPYRLDFTLETAPGFVTSRVTVKTRGEGWTRRIDLRRPESGKWSVRAESTGELDSPEPGGEMSRFEGAIDPDLGLSPVFNSLPVLRHGLLYGGEASELLMVWISVPDLALHPSRQRYAHLRPLRGGALIHFDGPDPLLGEDFESELSFDADGVVVDYPGIASRIHRPGARGRNGAS